MKHLYLLPLTLLMVLLVGCQAPTPQVAGSEASQPTPIRAGLTEAESESDGANASDALCPEVPRPALGLFIPDEGYLIADPVSGAECKTALDGDVPGLSQATGDALYYRVQEDEQFVVIRLGQNGEASPLSFTAVDRDDALLYHSFVVSPDGSRIAWSTTSAGPDAASPPTSTIWVANTDGSDIVNVLPEIEAEGVDGRTRALVPVRFSKDGSTLFYTFQVETGGIWSAFVGNYDNLYGLRLNAVAQPTQIFDCPGDDTTTRMCIGDFYEVQGEVEALAYVDGQTLFIVDGMGNVRNTIDLEGDYLGYPTFGPRGDLVFYSAAGATSITPDEGTIYYVTAPLVQSDAPEVLAVDTRLLRPRGWLDAGHVVTGYVTGDNGGSVEWGTAVVRLDGSIQVIESEPTADFIDVLPAPGETTSECPEPAPETALLKNERLGYCFLYPDEYTVEPREDGDEAVTGSSLNHLDPRFGIFIEDAAGRTVQEAADAWLNEWASSYPSFELPHRTITLDGEEAVVVDDVPLAIVRGASARG